MPWYWWIVLPSTVWVIYTLDHLFDGLKVKEQAQTIRHQMHYKHRKLIFWLVGIISVVNIYLVLFYFDKELIEFGVTLSACVGAYLIIYQLFNRSTKKSYLKEITIALIYTVGIVGGVWVTGMHGSFQDAVIITGLFALLAFCNLLIFSLFDCEKDRKNGFTSLAQSIGERKVHLISLTLLIGMLIFLGTLLFANWMEVIVIPTTLGHTSSDMGINNLIHLSVIFLMTIGLLALLTFPKWFAVNERYRFLGDGVFLFPLILLCV